MNNLLNLKVSLTSEKNNATGGPVKLVGQRSISSLKVASIIAQLEKVKEFFKSNNIGMKKVLIDVYYDSTIAKSNRISYLLKEDGVKDINDNVVGARFYDYSTEQRHVITYYISYNAIDASIERLKTIIKILNDYFDGNATTSNFNNYTNKINDENMSNTMIRNFIVDCSVVSKIDVPNNTELTVDDDLDVLVTFYKTDFDISAFLQKICKEDSRFFNPVPFGDNTYSVNHTLFTYLKNNFYYLFSMATIDYSKIDPKSLKKNKEIFDIPKPKDEPTIGVIDTCFDQDVYFKEWVDYRSAIDSFEEQSIDDDSKYHGTAVSSIIVDGPALNPELDDGCGRFKVRHYAVCTNRIYPSRLARKINDIVKKNPDIQVWNLSLGTDEEISRNFISFVAATIDKLQKDYNIIFVISGTNYLNNSPLYRKKVGSPADSLNAIVVNSVKKNNAPTSYSRRGKVLSFFNKPDVCYYGGDEDEKIKVYSIDGVTEDYGTSFASPWIARKLAFLIHVMGFQREVAKALLIDAAAGWEFKQNKYSSSDLLGYGVVPIKIEDVIKCENSEIKFFIYGTAKAYKTSYYSIPVPKDENMFPYIARATLCYFPDCNRNQGVDYTSRELSIKFGRINDSDKIIDINDNSQDESGVLNTEEKCRREFRKWENTKFISSISKEKNKSLKTYGDRLWGFSIYNKERISGTDKDINFGVVFTLKEIKGINRIEEFKTACLLRGIIVNEINIDNKIKLYAKVQEDLDLE